MTRPLNLYCTTRVLLRLYKLGIIGTSAQAWFCISMIRGNLSMNVLIPRVESSGRRFSIQLLHSLQKAYNLGSNWGNWRKKLDSALFWCKQIILMHSGYRWVQSYEQCHPPNINQPNQTRRSRKPLWFWDKGVVFAECAEKNTGHNIQ